MEKISKTEIKQHIEKFFENIKSKSPKEIKKIKKLGMRYGIKLGEKRKLFCKKCFGVYKNPKIKIKRGIKRIICGNCGVELGWRVR